MRRLYGILPWGIIGLGAVHVAATWRLFDALTARSLWFLSGGLLLILCGAINLLNRAYGATAPGLRWTCRAANAMLLGVSIAMAIVDRPGWVSVVFVVGLAGATSLLSWLPASARPSRAPGLSTTP